MGCDGLKSRGPPGNFQTCFMEGHLSWGRKKKKKKSSVFSWNVMLLFKSTGEQGRIPGSQSSHAHPTAQSSVVNWFLAMATLMTKIKAMMSISLRGLQEPWIKTTDHLGPSLTASTTCSLAELVCSFLRWHPTGRNKFYNSDWGD